MNQLGLLKLIMEDAFTVSRENLVPHSSHIQASVKPDTLNRIEYQSQRGVTFRKPIERQYAK